MLKVIKGGDVYTPEYIGKKDILLTDSKIHMITDEIDIDKFPVEVEVIYATGDYVVPGFIDSHVHITGGGGEGGFKTRTPEIQLSDLIISGITTVIGCLGTDGITRSGEDLLAKTRALIEEGMSAYMYTGSYGLPVKTITGEIKKDIILINEILGIGEIAISDHRSSQPTLEQLRQAAAEARVGGILSDKAGIVNLHIGDGDDELDMLEKIVMNSELPKTQFVPTHINRNSKLLKRGLDYALQGGLVDFTTSTTDKFLEDGETKCSRALKHFLEEGVKIDKITFTSDGQGSLPEFDEQGNFVGLKIGQVSSLFREVRDAVISQNVELSEALNVITSNPARNLKLKEKGKLIQGNDADIVILDGDELQIKTTIAMGNIMLKNGQVMKKGTFE